jgi:hypothetical protein
MDEYRGNFDYFLWLNAHEEATFQECLSEYRQEWPQAEQSEARAKLQEGLVALLESGNIGLYAEKWARPETRRDLELKEACKAVRDHSNWKSPDDTEWFHYIYAAKDWTPV